MNIDSCYAYLTNAKAHLQGITNILYGKIKTSSSKNRYFSKAQEIFPKNLLCYPQFGTIYVYISVHILTDTANACAGARLSFYFF